MVLVSAVPELLVKSVALPVDSITPVSDCVRLPSVESPPVYVPEAAPAPVKDAEVILIPLPNMAFAISIAVADVSTFNSVAIGIT